MLNKLHSEVLESFIYKDGGLYWKHRGVGRSLSGRAGTVIKKGYRQIRFNSVSFKEHRLIFLFHHGYIPEFIDHINGDRSDNRIENLRACTKSGNNRNSRTPNTNKSGVKGVFWDNTANKWCARIYADGKFRLSKLFDDLGEAAKCVADARKQIHGEFARHA